jgi:hypothetical protein
MTEYVKKKNIRSPRPRTIQHVDKGDFRKPEGKSKADIAKENREKNLERTSGGGGIHAGKSKDKIAKEKSFVAKQKVKEAKKPPTVKEKKDLDATPKRKSTHPIFKNKGKSIEIKQKPKEKKGSFVEGIKKGTETLKKIFTRNGKAKVSTPEKHPAHDPDKGGGIHKGKPPKGAQAAEPKIVPKKKPLSPEQEKRQGYHEGGRSPKKKS